MQKTAFLRLGMSNTFEEPIGWTDQDRNYRSPCFGFVKDVFVKWYETGLDNPFKDFIFDSEQFEFRVGLPKGNYSLKLYFYDPTKIHCKMSVILLHTGADLPEGSGRRLAAYQVVPGLLEPYVLHITEFEHPGGVLGIMFRGEGGGDAIVNAIEFYSKHEATPIRIYPEAPPADLPTKESLLQEATVEPKRRLEAICEWLLNHRDSDGFMGDFESNKRLWYTASYPIRTLLAQYDITGNSLYLNAATQIVDRFVEEQAPNGGFFQTFFGVPTAKRTVSEFEALYAANWMNLADVGSMVAALIAAAHYVDGERKIAYTNAARRYLDDWVKPRIQPNGGVKNGWLGAQGEAQNIYSVSTAMTALSMAMFYNLTGEECYLQQAGKTVSFLLDDWGEDGTIRKWNFDTEYPGEGYRLPPYAFGDSFYVFEALSALATLTSDDALRYRIYQSLKKSIYGSQGLLHFQGDKPWWSLQSIWHNSKSAGMLMIYQDYYKLDKLYGEDNNLTTQFKSAYRAAQKYLLSEDSARQLGVMLNDPEDKYPFGPHSLQSWSGCAVAASGFAGLSVAQIVKYGVIYQKK